VRSTAARRCPCARGQNGMESVTGRVELVTVRRTQDAGSVTGRVGSLAAARAMVLAHR
jgi:hypothetical protein